ncbi:MULTISPECIES: hypothetical protein [unclassified Mesorhizobium]|uniref:hypothetical protein n=1 Tax=unclassified Mesorhizobium TaxID=325217 RepID=UPI0003F4F608|nr:MULTISPECIES: hypothetical protein [unclassified Mesorhizobium]WJI77989.1 hypothetical protein NLY37_15360 [Mesorhizobium sp. C395A]
MAKIRGIDDLTWQQLLDEINRGGKFVCFQYCFSIIVLTFRRSTDVYFIRAGENASRHHLPYTLLSLVAGWRGVPWGVIYTPAVLATNLSGGKDVTASILRQIAPTA